MSRRARRPRRASDEKRWRDRFDGAQDRAAVDDRKWFADRPGQTYRLRRSLPGEGVLNPDLLSFMLVKQVVPGVRVRVGFFFASTPPIEALSDAFGDLMMAEARRVQAGLADLEAKLMEATKP